MRGVITTAVLVALAACGAPAIDDSLATDGVTLPDRVPPPGDTDGGAAADTSTGPQTNNVNLTVTLSGSGGGTISSTPNGLACAGATCKGSFARGTAVTLVATPAAGSVFAGWTAPCAGTSSCAATLDGDVNGAAAFQSLAGPWTGTYTNTRVAAGCTFTNAGNLSATLKANAGAFSSAETITGLELRSIPSCALVGKTTGAAADAPVTVANDTITGTWTFTVQGGGGTLAFPFTAKVAGKTMTGSWTCATCTGSFTLKTP